MAVQPDALESVRVHAAPVRVFTIDAGEAGAFPCSEGETLLAALRPVHKTKIVSGCRGGGCGICKVRIVAGAAHFGLMSRAHIDGDDRANGFALACQTFPQADMTIQIMGLSAWRASQQKRMLEQ